MAFCPTTISKYKISEISSIMRHRTKKNYCCASDELEISGVKRAGEQVGLDEC